MAPAPAAAASEGSARLLGSHLLLRLVAMGGLLAVYYALEWRALRQGLREALVPVLGLLGHPSAPLDAGTDLLLVVDGRHAFAIGANCTYADLVLVAAPFCWRFGRPFSVNLLRLGGLAAAVFVVNLGRVAAALALFADGVSWPLAHTVPDLSIHGVFLAVVVLAALRSDHAAAPGTATGHA